MQRIRKTCLALSVAAVLAVLVGLVADAPAVWQPAAVLAGLAAAIGFGAVEALKGYQYTAWVIAGLIAALTYPAPFQSWGDFDLGGKFLITTVIQLVMFGMATQMRLADFNGVVRHPRGVVVGLVGHYSVMPVAAFVLVHFVDLPDEIGMGVILYGCVASGLASNVMSLMARANLALAVTVTALSTVLSPVTTPLLMKLFAGRLVDVVFLDIMLDVIRITLVPVCAALLVDYLRTARRTGRRVVDCLAVVSAGWLAYIALGGWNDASASLSETPMALVESVSYMAAALIVARVFHLLVSGPLPQLQKAMPMASMIGIMYYNTITTAAGRDALLSIGLTLLAVGLVHNCTGYLFGYWGSRAVGLDQSSARAVSFEVGMQNGGMATGLAASMGMVGTAGLPAAVFSPLGNITGSLLANYWSRRPPRDGDTGTEPEPAPGSEAPADGSPQDKELTV
ncbi:bile acid:sodium symporter family protein [Streptomyces olivaceus]|uniref:bile acid:sodium symporter family protein n=1 Tax=Streptomyces olivaceus TaxID=47716 RepID=UPI0022ED5DA8|nr:bile acid:sodium symporter family protein [Streptomyces olivaceus]GHI93091.1 sodium transporter [Streptomyces olivaceus]